MYIDYLLVRLSEVAAKGEEPCLFSHVKPGANANHCKEGHDERSEDLSEKGSTVPRNDLQELEQVDCHSEIEETSTTQVGL